MEPGGMIMQKRLHLALFGALVAGMSLASGLSPAFASTRHTTLSRTPLIRTEQHGFHPHGWQTHNQYFHGNSYSGIHLNFWGHNQNNTGNQGHNRWYNVNFAANGGKYDCQSQANKATSADQSILLWEQL